MTRVALKDYENQPKLGLAGNSPELLSFVRYVLPPYTYFPESVSITKIKFKFKRII